MKPSFLLCILCGASLVGCDDGDSSQSGGRYFGYVRATQALTVTDYAPMTLADPPRYSGPIARGRFPERASDPNGVVITLYAAKGPLGPKAWVVQTDVAENAYGATWYDEKAPAETGVLQLNFGSVLTPDDRIDVALTVDNANEPVEIHLSDPLCASTIESKLTARGCRARGGTECEVKLPAGRPDCAPDLR